MKLKKYQFKKGPKKQIVIKRWLKLTKKKCNRTPCKFGNSAWKSRRGERRKGGEKRKGHWILTTAHSLTCAAPMEKTYWVASNATKEGDVQPLEKVAHTTKVYQRPSSVGACNASVSKFVHARLAQFFLFVWVWNLIP
jgi:hypothetical protein